MEMVDVYSAEHERTGLVIERDEVPPKGEYLLVVHLCAFNRRGELLVQRRHPNKDRYSGMWDLSAGGFAASGETPPFSVVRETEEEIGVQLSEKDIFFLFTEAFSYVLDDFFCTEIPVNTALRLQEDEVIETAWVSCSRVLQLRREGQFVDYDIHLLERLFTDADALLHFEICSNA